jgi:hypothetical protein
MASLQLQRRSKHYGTRSTWQSIITLLFYFVIHPSDKGYLIEGEGTGSKDATDAALAELKALTESDIAALIEQTKRH